MPRYTVTFEAVLAVNVTADNERESLEKAIRQAEVFRSELATDAPPWIDFSLGKVLAIKNLDTGDELK